ncbi:MAG TPA: DUF2231 domain-containing protein [Planctomycetota bacterium]|nr:DUF2231 domain-containing protein [Planctomycetota bacterium]
MTGIALAAGGDPSLWSFFGRFHPATVHFPIAMLSIAALMEFLQIIRKKPGLHAAAVTLTVVAVVSAVAATLMGLANATGRKPNDTLEAHRWAGIVTTVVAMIALFLVHRARAAEGRKVQIARGSLFLGMILVSITGHWGGVLVYGPDYYSEALPEWLKFPKKNPPPPLQKPRSKVDFVKDIAPIIEASCFKCHGGAKGTKGKLSLATKALAMKGGANGEVIKPRDPASSSFYTLLLEEDEEKRMPEKAKALPQEQILEIKKWIEEGAEWPDGFEFKK